MLLNITPLGYRSWRHLFPKVRFHAMYAFTWRRGLFPADHSVRLRGGHHRTEPAAVCQHGDHLPWVGTAQSQFRTLESLTLFGITNRPTRYPHAIWVLSAAATPVKNLELAGWKISSKALVDFICVFPSLDNPNVEETGYLTGLPGWKPPPTFPSSAGHFGFKHHDGRGPVASVVKSASFVPRNP